MFDWKCKNKNGWDFEVSGDTKIRNRRNVEEDKEMGDDLDLSLHLNVFVDDAIFSPSSRDPVAKDIKF